MAHGQAAPPPATDPALGALIPDSALANPTGWALGSDAAHQSAPATTDAPPDTAALPDTALAPLPGLTIDWPGPKPPRPPASLAPEADIARAADAADEASAALDVALPRGGWRGPLGPDALVHGIGAGVVLAMPRDSPATLIDQVAARFAPLSSLRTLGHGDDNLAQVSRRAHDDVALLEQILRLYGYYDAEVNQTLSGIGAAHAKVRFEIVPGPCYALARIDTGDLARSPDAAQLEAALALKPGDPADTEAIIAARTRLIARLGAIGYAFARVGDPQLTVDHAAHDADLALATITGGTYDFGAITSSLPRFLNARHLQRMARFRPGARFDARQLDDLRRALLSTGIIGGVTITPREARAPAGSAPGIADIDVRLTRGPQHSLTGAIGQSSGQGVFIEASWEDRNLFPPEGLLRLRGILGTRDQLAGVTVRRSNFLARDTAITADLYAQVQLTDAYDAHTLSATATLEKQSTLIFQKTWAWSLGVQTIGTRELAAGAAPGTPFSSYFIAALPARLAYDGSDNLLDPTRGWRAAITLSPAISVQGGPRATYLLTKFDASAYQPVGGGVILAERVRVGSITGTALANIAPSQRLYAGGAASVRGYGYQAVGPRDSTNTPTGGLSLTEFSLEARVRTRIAGGAVSLVPFVDAGTIGETPTPVVRGAKYGAGIGLRYKTPFGPIRVDLGTPLNRSPGDSRIGVYIALGQAF